MKQFTATFLAILAAAAVIFGIWKYNAVQDAKRKDDIEALRGSAQLIQAMLRLDETRGAGSDLTQLQHHPAFLDSVMSRLNANRIPRDEARKLAFDIIFWYGELLESPYYKGQAFLAWRSEIEQRLATLKKAIELQEPRI
jgi:ATP phosphoribosyltransferase regulatory subunit HisZ